MCVEQRGCGQAEDNEIEMRNGGDGAGGMMLDEPYF